MTVPAMMAQARSTPMTTVDSKRQPAIARLITRGQAFASLIAILIRFIGPISYSSSILEISCRSTLVTMRASQYNAAPNTASMITNIGPRSDH